MKKLSQLNSTQLNSTQLNLTVKVFLVLCLNLFSFFNSTATDFAITFNVSHYQTGSNISCHGANDGMVEAVIVGGTPPYTYSWNTGSYNRVLTGLTAGTYTFTVTDAASQTISQSVDLIEPNNLQLFLWPEFYGGYNISEQGGSNGLIAAEVVGGSSPYIYSWSTGGTKSKLEDVPAGTYTLVLTDANGCTVSGTKTLTEPTPLHVVSITSPLHHGYHISCKGGNDGLIDLSVTGGVPPYKYDWNTGSFEEDINGLTAGEYSVRITDDNQAEIITSIILTQPAVGLKVTVTPQVYANGYNLSCHDCANGSLTAVGTGGVSPYTYLWSNGQTTSTISGLQAIDYKCFVTDANGCTNSEAFVLRSPDRDDWSMNGNANVDPVTQFMGTTDNRDFVFKTNNVERMRIKSSGVVQVSGGLKIDSISTDSLRAVYVDQGGVLRIVRSGTGSNCVGPINGWLANYCNLYPGNIYLQPGLNNVGIGTTTPTAKLDVVGDIQSSNLSSSAFSLLQSTSSGKIVKVLSATNPSTEVLYGNGSWAPLPIGASVWNYVGGYIYSNPLNAKVGINTSTPSEQLEVAGVIMTSATQNQGNSIKLWHDNLNGIISSFGAGNLLINYNNGKNVDICTGASSGSVSIGGNTYLALNNASVGIGTTLTNEILQIGDRFVFHNGGNKILGYNFASSAGAHRIKDDYSSALFFGPSGDIHLKVADNDVAGSSITWKESLNINSDSHLGFNTAPSSSAHVNARSSGMFLIDGVQSSLLIGNDNASTPYGEFGIEYMEDGPIAQQGLNFWKPYQATGMDGNYLMYITNYGNVGINVQDPSKLTDDEYKLSVNGGIRANKIKVYLYPWADYVFNPDYKLMPLKDLESFILKNKHLPGVESADEVETNGLDLGKNQAKLLEKIEELTLYVIIIKKENEKLNQVVMEMQSKMNK